MVSGQIIFSYVEFDTKITALTGSVRWVGLSYFKSTRVPKDRPGQPTNGPQWQHASENEGDVSECVTVTFCTGRWNTCKTTTVVGECSTFLWQILRCEQELTLRYEQPGSQAYARSEVHLTELLDEVCAEMKNYSGFTEDDGRTIYHRYQNRPGRCRRMTVVWPSTGILFSPPVYARNKLHGYFAYVWCDFDLIAIIWKTKI